MCVNHLRCVGLGLTGPAAWGWSWYGGRLCCSPPGSAGCLWTKRTGHASCPPGEHWTKEMRTTFEEVFIHCKDKIPKFRNKYSQKRNIGVSVSISTFMRLWVIYIFQWSVCLFCWRKYVDQSWDFINPSQSQTHECGNWVWGGIFVAVYFEELLKLSSPTIVVDEFICLCLV